ncbi:MAG: alpha/beta hydrolase [Treponemataceae bacterium]|nr:alpha/beta hydrolase [Treponemataceae bacterium]
MKKKLLIPIFAAILVSVAAAVTFYCADKLLSYALSPVPPEAAEDSPLYVPAEAPSGEDGGTEEAAEASEGQDAQALSDEAYRWLKSAAAVESITSSDGVRLNAYFVENKRRGSRKYAVVMHGYRSAPRSVAIYARHFYEQGFHVLVPGQRGHGWSGGRCIDMGALSKYDAASWIVHLSRKDTDAEILLHGVSMGAATVMLATGLALPANVRCAIEDCGYDTLYREFAFRMAEEFHLPAFPILNAASLLCRQKFGFFFGEVSPLYAVARSSVPTLFIHGTADTYVPFFMLGELYGAAAAPKEKHAVEGAEHGRSVYTAPEAYWNAVDSFAARYFD